MTGALPVFIKGIALGLGAAVPIGPVNVQIARRALREGFTSGLALGCGAVTVDVVYAILSSLGLRRVAEIPAVHWTLGVGGTVLLAYLGVTSLGGERQAWRLDPFANRTAAPPAAHRAAYLTGLLMTLLNPMTLAFWFVAVPALVGTIAADAGRDLPLLCAGVFAGTLSWVIFFAGTLAVAGRYRRNWWLALADAGGGAALLVFAVAALLHLIRSLL